MSRELIVTRNLTKTYEDNGVPVRAVRGVDMTVLPGEFTALIGPSGSGKTTLLNLVSGLDSPTSGTILLNGTNIGDMCPRELSAFRRNNIGFVFQAYNLIPVLTVEENVEYILLLQGMKKKQRHKKVMEILEKVGLEDCAHRLPSKLSGGQQQRVAVARAMVARPLFILADEPTANLDSVTSGRLLDMMKDLNEKTGMTYLFSTHDPRVMERARRILVVQDGLIVEDREQ
jgi:putative ABC transport system ATP-binding protein